jgi:hypothetical protein
MAGIYVTTRETGMDVATRHTGGDESMIILSLTHIVCYVYSTTDQ